jgi:sugar-specific transcriptional regulator TrmB/predicted hydrocarbon binding protein
MGMQTITRGGPLSEANNDLKAKLGALGFTELETNVYLALLQADCTRVSELSQMTKISRTQLYPLLRRMVCNNYIETVATKPIAYKAVSPAKLVGLLEERRKEQFSLLIDLRHQLDRARFVQRVAAPQYEINIITGEKNILSKIAQLTHAAEREIIKTDVFERTMAAKSKELREMNKRKAREGVKIVVHPAIKAENISNIGRFKAVHNGAVFGSMVGEEPYCTYVFDREKILLAFYNPQKEEYDTAIFIEKPELAEAFASKNNALIASHPLNGEVYTSAIKNQRAFLLPEKALDCLPKKQLLDLGYTVGRSALALRIKGRENRKTSQRQALSALSTQLSIWGWAKLQIENNSKRMRLTAENASVGCKLIEGALHGALSLTGAGHKIEETKCIKSGNQFCEFTIRLRQKGQ